MTRVIARPPRRMPSTISISTSRNPTASSNTFLPRTLFTSFRTRIFAPRFLRKQPYKSAPVVFLIAGEYDRASKGTDRETGLRLVNLEAGHAAQNLLLEATALNLGAVPVGGVDPKQAAQAASLPAAITPIYLVPVGHPRLPEESSGDKPEVTPSGNSASYQPKCDLSTTDRTSRRATGALPKSLAHAGRPSA